MVNLQVCYACFNAAAKGWGKFMPIDANFTELSPKAGLGTGTILQAKINKHTLKKNSVRLEVET